MSSNLTSADRNRVADAFLRCRKGAQLARLAENAASAEAAAAVLRDWWFDASRTVSAELVVPDGAAMPFWSGIDAVFGRVRGRRGRVGWLRTGTVTWLQVAERARFGVVLTDPGPEAESEPEAED